jgi:AcrR family transcriptional regulator
MATKRKYELKRRAESQAATRQRIVEAAVELHSTIGPARTTVMDIAKKAGVERVTVYRHFPNDLALFTACSAHYRALNPPPDMTPWRAIDDPVERLRVALSALYAYYEQAAPMLQNVLRDSEIIPSGQESMEPRRRYAADLRDVLARGWSVRGRKRQRLMAALALGLDFYTWRRLVRDEKLNPDDAVQMMTGLVRHAVHPEPNNDA